MVEFESVLERHFHSPNVCGHINIFFFSAFCRKNWKTNFSKDSSMLSESIYFSSLKRRKIWKKIFYRALRGMKMTPKYCFNFRYSVVHFFITLLNEASLPCMCMENSLAILVWSVLVMFSYSIMFLIVHLRDSQNAEKSRALLCRCESKTHTKLDCFSIPN